jgi:hypothetical protein
LSGKIKFIKNKRKIYQSINENSYANFWVLELFMEK